MDHETARDLYSNITQPTILVDPAIQRERDYWFKLYAGKIISGVVTLFGYDALHQPKKFLQLTKELATSLVDEMFKDEL